MSMLTKNTSTEEHIILYGGTFDPIHLGHIRVAEIVQFNFPKSKIVFAPNNLSPWDKQNKQESYSHRFQMIKLALTSIKSYEQFYLTDVGVGLNDDFAITMVEEFGSMYRTLFGFVQSSQLSWIMGNDCIENLHKWHKIDELMKLCNLISVPRPGYNCHLAANISPMIMKINAGTMIDISSSQIRANFVGKSHFLPAPVLAYIRENGLYSSAICT